MAKITTNQVLINIVGKTLINHKLRNELNLSVNEYCVIDFIDRLNNRKIKTTAYEAFLYLGVDEESYHKTALSLISKGFLTVKDNSYFSTAKWTENFQLKENEFDLFWESFKDIKWTGSKVDAKKKYQIVRKDYSAEYLLKQKEYYFMLLLESRESGFPRAVMGASVFLNMTTQRFTEDFKSQLRSKENINIPKEKPMTKDEYKNLYQ